MIWWCCCEVIIYSYLSLHQSIVDALKTTIFMDRWKAPIILVLWSKHGIFTMHMWYIIWLYCMYIISCNIWYLQCISKLFGHICIVTHPMMGIQTWHNMGYSIWIFYKNGLFVTPQLGKLPQCSKSSFHLSWLSSFMDHDNPQHIRGSITQERPINHNLSSISPYCIYIYICVCMYIYIYVCIYIIYIYIYV